MSRPVGGRRSRRGRGPSEPVFLPVERELPEGYVEVEITGVSLGRFAAIYGALMRDAWASLMGSVPSALRPDAPTEV